MRQLLVSAGWDRDISPVYSSTGILLFASDMGGYLAVFRFDERDLEEGWTQPGLMTAEMKGDEASPDWSPDGEAFVFESNMSGDYDIYVYWPTEGWPTPITESGAEDRFPSWSTDGSRVAFMSNRNGNWDIFTIGVDGEGLTRIAASQAEEMFPTWFAEAISEIRSE